MCRGSAPSFVLIMLAGCRIKMLSWFQLLVLRLRSAYDHVPHVIVCHVVRNAGPGLYSVSTRSIWTVSTMTLVLWILGEDVYDMGWRWRSGLDTCLWCGRPGFDFHCDIHQCVPQYCMAAVPEAAVSGPSQSWDRSSFVTAPSRGVVVVMHSNIYYYLFINNINNQ